MAYPKARSDNTVWDTLGLPSARRRVFIHTQHGYVTTSGQLVPQNLQLEYTRNLCIFQRCRASWNGMWVAVTNALCESDNMAEGINIHIYLSCTMPLDALNAKRMYSLLFIELQLDINVYVHLDLSMTYRQGRSDNTAWDTIALPSARRRVFIHMQHAYVTTSGQFVPQNLQSSW